MIQQTNPLDKNQLDKYHRSESFFTTNDGTQIFTQKWIKPDAQGSILFTHGQAEHSDCYSRLISAFANENWNFIGWDLRGHGKSSGLRGYAEDFSNYVDDFHLFLSLSLDLPEVKSNPVILLGHSMGGLVQTCALIDEKNEKTHQAVREKVTAQVLSSPLFGVSVEVPLWKDAGAVLLNSTFPKLTLGNELKYTDITHDPNIIREYEQDTYRHNKISSGVYLGMKREFPHVFSSAQFIELPTLLHISDNDPIVSSPAAVKFFEQLPNSVKEIHLFPGAKHELYNDINRHEVFPVVIQFLKQFTASAFKVKSSTRK